MEFKEKYTSVFLKAADELKEEEEEKTEKGKVELSNDAFAIGETIQYLINKIEHARMSLIK